MIRGLRTQAFGTILLSFFCLMARSQTLSAGPITTEQASATKSSSTSTTEPKRDQAALLALARMQAASGWPTDDSIKDVIIKATMTVTPLNGAPHTDQITIKARCSDERVSIQNETTGAVTLKLDEMGIYHNGSDLRSIPWLSFEPFFGSYIPCLLPYFHFSDVQRDVTYDGEANVSGSPVLKISTQQTDKETGVRADLRRRASKMTLAISRDTYLPLEAEIEMTLQNFTTRIPTKISFSNYQQTNGISIPYQIDISPKRQATFKMVLQSVQWNSGLTEGDFSPR